LVRACAVVISLCQHRRLAYSRAADSWPDIFDHKHAVRLKTLTSFKCYCHHSGRALHIKLSTPDYLWYDYWTPQHRIQTYHESYRSRLLGGLSCSNRYLQRRPLSLTKPTNPNRIYQQNRPRMALPLPVSF